jgi:hypothetical protein
MLSEHINITTALDHDFYGWLGVRSRPMGLENDRLRGAMCNGGNQRSKVYPVRIHRSSRKSSTVGVGVVISLLISW